MPVASADERMRKFKYTACVEGMHQYCVGAAPERIIIPQFDDGSGGKVISASVCTCICHKT